MSSILEDELVLDAATIAGIESAGDNFKVVDVQLDKVDIPPDDLEEIVVGSFTLISHGGLYNVRVPWSREWDVELGATMALRASELDAVYAYPVEV